MKKKRRPIQALLGEFKCKQCKTRFLKINKAHRFCSNKCRNDFHNSLTRQLRLRYRKVA